MDPSAHNPFALDDTVGRKRPACDHHDAAQEPSAAKRQATPAKHKANRQDDVLAAIGARVVTERYILDTVGDNRYTREILRRLVALEVVQRTGVGGPSDPFLYKFLRPVAEAEALGKVDPAQQQRSQRIEHKILSFLGEQHGFVLERLVRLSCGDNTGTGSALRRLVSDGRVERAGRGGSSDPFTYCMASAETVMLCEPQPVPAATEAPDNEVSMRGLACLWRDTDLLQHDAETSASEADTDDAGSLSDVPLDSDSEGDDSVMMEEGEHTDMSVEEEEAAVHSFFISPDAFEEADMADAVTAEHAEEVVMEEREAVMEEDDASLKHFEVDMMVSELCDDSVARYLDL